MMLFTATTCLNMVEQFLQHCQFSVQVATEENNVGKMLMKYPWILSTSIQENYKEVLSFLDKKVWKDFINVHSILTFCQVSR